jgi:hypothetical protein
MDLVKTAAAPQSGDRLRQALAEPVQTRLWEEAQAMTLDQATEYALNN